MNRADARVAMVPASVVCRTTLAVLLFVFLGACVAVAPVIQGKVVSADGGRTLRVQDELRPADPPLAFDVSRADIGGRPTVGETVRIVYRDDGGVRRALAVMSVSRQRRIEATGR